MLIFGYVVAQFIVLKSLLTFFDMTYTLAAGRPQRRVICATLQCSHESEHIFHTKEEKMTTTHNTGTIRF